MSDHNDTAEHIATAIDYDKVFGGRRTKGYEVLRQDTRDFVDALKEKGFTPPAPKATYEQEAFEESSFTSVPTAYTSYTTEDKEKFHQIQEQHIEDESRDIQKIRLFTNGTGCILLYISQKR